MLFDFILKQSKPDVVEDTMVVPGRQIPLDVIRNHRARRYLLRLRHDGSVRLPEAEGLFRQAAVLKFLGNDHPSLAATLNHLALVLREEGKLNESQAVLQQVVEIRPKPFGEADPSVTATLLELTNVIGLKENPARLGGNP